MQLSAMAPGCPSTEARDAGLCPPHKWNETELIEDYTNEILDAIEHGIDGFFLWYRY